MKWIDIPPVWLGAAVALAWVIGRWDPLQLSFGGAWAEFAAGLLIGGGILLMLLAVLEMRRWRTTVIPHREARHLVRSGIFKRSRNPIYLGDVAVLAGIVLWLDAPLALPVVPLFLRLLERRFVLAEERRLAVAFGAAFGAYCRETRRWI